MWGPQTYYTKGQLTLLWSFLKKLLIVSNTISDKSLKHCAKNFTYIISLNPFSTLLNPIICIDRKVKLREVSHLPKVT